MNDAAAFARLVGALRPWLGQLVFVGGWAHRLHRLSPLADPPAYAPILTMDADLAVSPREPLMGDIAAALRAADFKEEFSGDHTPPVTHFVFGEGSRGFFAEFLAPLRGSGIKRSGEPDVTVTRAGVTAQKVRYLELLLLHSITVQLNREAGFPLERPASVQLPNPVGFIAQKLLIQGERRPDKRAQDMLYIHDTLELFGPNVSALREMWKDTIRPTLPPKTAARVERLAREQFTEVNDTIRSAARIPQDRSLAPARLQALCDYGLGEIFG